MGDIEFLIIQKRLLKNFFNFMIEIDYIFNIVYY